MIYFLLGQLSHQFCHPCRACDGCSKSCHCPWKPAVHPINYRVWGPPYRRAKAAHSSTGTKSDFNRDILSPLVQSHWLFQSMQSTHPLPDVIHEYPHKYASLEYQQTKQLLTHWGFRLWLKHGIVESAGSSRSKLNWLRLTCPVLHGQRWKLNRHNPHCGIKECGDNFHFKRLLSQASYSGRLRHSGKKGL